MADEHDVKARIDELILWLDREQRHLDRKSRRDMIEQVIGEYAEAVRRKEARRASGRDVLLYGSLITLAITLVPKLIETLQGILR